MITLCCPSQEVTCFACCPPIRPPGYDHLCYVKSLKREFRENRHSFIQGNAPYRPITGFSCWAIGYIDSRYRRIGCLLHPHVNNGKDLRHITGYWGKCSREMCRQARIFLRLPYEEKLFWLELAAGLNSFFFSSPRANLLFHLLLWHEDVLGIFYAYANRRNWNCTELTWKFPFLIDKTIHPRAWRYIVHLITKNISKSQTLAEIPWAEFFEIFNTKIEESRIYFQESSQKMQKDAHYVHLLGLSSPFEDFLRFFIGLCKINEDCARKWEKIVNDIVIEVLTSFHFV